MSGDLVFLSEAELEKYLIGISPSYAEYAAPLWRAKVTRTSELAAASVDAYKEAGVPPFSASNIKARADAALKAAGTGTAAGPSGGPVLFENVVLHILLADGGEETKKLKKASRAGIAKVLDRYGCATVFDPDTQEDTLLEGVELHDGMLLKAQAGIFEGEERVSTVEGFTRSKVKRFEQEATEKARSILLEKHRNAQVLDVSVIKAADGRKRQVDGIVLADGCAGIMEAKTQVDGFESVQKVIKQLETCMDIITKAELTGPSAQLKDKKLLGFIATEVVPSNPTLDLLVSECRERGWTYLVPTGQSLGPGNSWVPKLDVKCGLRTTSLVRASKVSRTIKLPSYGCAGGAARLRF